MKQRIKAAWMVLRGEWTAGPRTSPWVATPFSATNSTGNYTVTWTQLGR